MKRVGILGGSFDPPHISHKAIIDGCIRKGFVDEVWVVPSKNHTQKNNEASFFHRIEMCKIMFYPVKVKEDDCHNHSGRMIDLMHILNFFYNSKFFTKHQKYDFYIIIGEDCADNIESWYSWKKLISENKFIVVQRGDYHSPKPKDWYRKSPHEFVKIEGCFFSSSYVRKIFRHKNIVSILTSPRLVNYAVKNSLYIQEKQ